MLAEESLNELEAQEIDEESAPIHKKIPIIRIPKSDSNSYENIILNDINELKPLINEYLKENALTTTTTPLYLININEKEYKLNLPVFSYIIHDPIGDKIPPNLLLNYMGETNYSGQTPLMFAAAIDNVNYVKQLIRYDIGCIDEFGKSALDYAYEFKSIPVIIDILEQFEYGS